MSGLPIPRRPQPALRPGRAAIPGGAEVSIWHVQNPDEPPKAFIVKAPICWGPYFTTPELQAGYDELKAAGEI